MRKTKATSLFWIVLFCTFQRLPKIVRIPIPHHLRTSTKTIESPYWKGQFYEYIMSLTPCWPLHRIYKNVNSIQYCNPRDNCGIKRTYANDANQSARSCVSFKFRDARALTSCTALSLTKSSYPLRATVVKAFSQVRLRRACSVLSTIVTRPLTGSSAGVRPDHTKRDIRSNGKEQVS